MTHFEDLFETAPEIEINTSHPDKPSGSDDQGWCNEPSICPVPK